MLQNDKLYVITRRDLAPGYQSVQGMHAAIDFIFHNPEIAADWHNVSNYLGFLSVENEQELVVLAEQAEALGIAFCIFREPDIDDKITAIALAPGHASKKLCSKLPLTLKDKT